MAVRNYNLAEVQAIFGPVEMGGYGEEGGVRIEWQENLWEYSRHADGGGTRTKNNANDALVTVTLSQSSEKNAELSAIVAVDKLTGAGVNPMMVRDINGTTLLAGTSAWIEKRPDVEFNKAVTARVWVFHVENFDGLIGSGNEATSS
jgi:hypothetical protein